MDRVLSREKYRTAPIRQRFFALAAERWIVERNLAANRRYSMTHTASVFEDKLDFDDRHRKAAETSRFAARFSHVELDNSVDLDEFARLDREFDELSGKAGCRPSAPRTPSGSACAAATTPSASTPPR